MFALFFIGLREGLEAALIVSILLAYLRRTGRPGARHLWLGVGAALATVVVVFAIVTVLFDSLPFEAQEAVGGIMSILAAGLIAWMIFWMRRTAHGLKRSLEGELDRAIELGPWAVAGVAFVSVGREGLETAAIIWSTVVGSYTAAPFIGVMLGIAAAVFLGWLIYRGALKLNLGVFFTVTGYLLIVVAAGVLAYGVHDLQEAGWIPGINSVLFDISSVIDPSSWVGVLLKGTINFNPAPTVLEFCAWVGFLAIVLPLYARPVERKALTTTS